MEDKKHHPIQQTMHGGDLYGASLQSSFAQEELLDFSANINPLGMPKGVREAVIKGLSRSLHYPDPFCRKLCKALGEKEGVSADAVLCGNGGADLIYRLVYALKPRKALVTAPAFGEYEEALGQTEAEICYYRLPASMEIGEGILEAVTEDVDLVFLCNPNNPTGILTDRKLLIKLLKRAEAGKTWVCVDECFLDFVREKEAFTLTGYLAEYPKLVILKSFTKLYAMPGLRLGYVLSGSRELLERMRRAGQPWAVSEPAMEAGLAALEEQNFREQTLALVEGEREQLEAKLKGFGFQVWPGKADYLCFRALGEPDLHKKLLERGIVIRHCANYQGLTEEDYRVAVRTHEENMRLLEAVEAVLG